MSPKNAWWALVLASLLVGCSSTRVVRLDTGRGTPLEHVPASWDAAADGAWNQAMRRDYGRWCQGHESDGD